MERITVTIDTENDAFLSDNSEVGRILRKLADTLETESWWEASGEVKLYDENGNVVGKAVIR